MSKSWIARAVLLCLLGLRTTGGVRPAAARARPSPPTEIEVRGAFLLNFAGFVTWPDGARGNPEAATVIGVLGDERLSEVLALALESERPRSRAFSLTVIDSPDQLTSCHILYVGEATPISALEVLAAVGDSPVLTVSSREGFTDQGGIIGLFSEKGRMRFDINRRSERHARLQISSRLLRLARKLLE